MKKSLIIGTALVACMVVLTLMSGLAQAQITPPFVNPTQFRAGVCTIGPQAGDVLFRCSNLGFTIPSPWIVLCQTRNSPEEFVDFSDQFACQVIGTTLQDNGSVWVRIHRLDIPGAGWTQNLQINLLIINHG